MFLFYGHILTIGLIGSFTYLIAPKYNIFNCIEESTSLLPKEGLVCLIFFFKFHHQIYPFNLWIYFTFVLHSLVILFLHLAILYLDATSNNCLFCKKRFSYLRPKILLRVGSISLTHHAQKWANFAHGRNSQTYLFHHNMSLFFSFLQAVMSTHKTILQQNAKILCTRF